MTESLFECAAAEAREAAKAFPNLARMFNDFAGKFDRAARYEQALDKIEDEEPALDVGLLGRAYVDQKREIAREALRG